MLWQYIFYIQYDYRGQCYKTFTTVSYEGFVPGKPLQPSVMFVGKARSLPLSGAPDRLG